MGVMSGPPLVPEVMQLLSGIAHILQPRMRSIIHGAIDGGGILGVRVQMALLMRIPARGVNDTHVAVTVRSDVGLKHARLRPFLIRRLVQRRYQTG